MSNEYTLTRIKQIDNPEVEFGYIPEGHTVQGKFDVGPIVGQRFIFSGKRISDWLSTSIVQEVDEDVEPGITFITTMNSIYKLERNHDA